MINLWQIYVGLGIFASESFGCESAGESLAASSFVDFLCVSSAEHLIYTICKIYSLNINI